MKGPGEILLISCYELGHQPIALASPLAFLEQAGYFPDIIDLSVQKLDMAKIKRARLIAISVPMHTALRIGSMVSTRVRENNTTCHITFFGLYSSLNKDALLGKCADSIIGGEYETALVSLVKSLEANGGRPIEGVSTRRNNAAPTLTHLPFIAPRRTLLPPLEKYAHLEENGTLRQVGYVEASRGCRYHCRHCPIPSVYDGRFFLIPREVVLEDIKSLVEMGATHITFGDPDFLNGPVHSLRIVRSMHAHFPDLTFDFTAKIEHLIRDQSSLSELAELGCIFVVSAAESLSNTILSYLDKNHTRADITRAVHLTRQAGITLRPSLVPFTPWTTIEDIIDLFDFVEKEGLIDALDPVQYTIRLLIPPGSLLLSEPSITPHLGPLIQELFTYHWTHPDPRVDRLQEVFAEEVEKGTQEEVDPAAIFYQLKEIAYAVYEGRPPVTITHPVHADRKRPPRLTEPWFCCAEPTKQQFEIIQERT